MRLLLPALLAILLFPGPALANPINIAIDDAVAAFERAAPRLAATEMGVDVLAYRDALIRGRFASTHWGGMIDLDVMEQPEANGDCARFAAYVRIPPENSRVSLVVCPQFSSDGADALRRLTILHEMVHVVAGPDECRAMAFAARIEQLAFGNFTPVERYWQANACAGSAFRLP
jgi:hypothetical protein